MSRFRGTPGGGHLSNRAGDRRRALPHMGVSLGRASSGTPGAGRTKQFRAPDGFYVLWTDKATSIVNVYTPGSATPVSFDCGVPSVSLYGISDGTNPTIAVHSAEHLRTFQHNGTQWAQTAVVVGTGSTPSVTFNHEKTAVIMAETTGGVMAKVHVATAAGITSYTPGFQTVASGAHAARSGTVLHTGDHFVYFKADGSSVWRVGAAAVHPQSYESFDGMPHDVNQVVAVFTAYIASVVSTTAVSSEVLLRQIVTTGVPPYGRGTVTNGVTTDDSYVSTTVPTLFAPGLVAAPSSHPDGHVVVIGDVNTDDKRLYVQDNRHIMSVATGATGTLHAGLLRVAVPSWTAAVEPKGTTPGAGTLAGWAAMANGTRFRFKSGGKYVGVAGAPPLPAYDVFAEWSIDTGVRDLQSVNSAVAPSVKQHISLVEQPYRFSVDDGGQHVDADPVKVYQSSGGDKLLVNMNDAASGTTYRHCLRVVGSDLLTSYSQDATQFDLEPMAAFPANSTFVYIEEEGTAYTVSAATPTSTASQDLLNGTDSITGLEYMYGVNTWLAVTSTQGSNTKLNTWQHNGTVWTHQLEVFSEATSAYQGVFTDLQHEHVYAFHEDSGDILVAVMDSNSTSSYVVAVTGATFRKACPAKSGVLLHVYESAVEKIYFVDTFGAAVALADQFPVVGSLSDDVNDVLLADGSSTGAATTYQVKTNAPGGYDLFTPVYGLPFDASHTGSPNGGYYWYINGSGHLEYQGGGGTYDTYIALGSLMAQASASNLQQGVSSSLHATNGLLIATHTDTYAGMAVATIPGDPEAAVLQSEAECTTRIKATSVTKIVGAVAFHATQRHTY